MKKEYDCPTCGRHWEVWAEDHDHSIQCMSVTCLASEDRGTLEIVG